MDELPKTLQHAVWTVRALGISYIWIDALCIIQDDLNDWTKEASQMGHTYQQSCVTIAATTSKSSFDGFLHDRGPCFRVASDFIFKEFQSYHSETLEEVLGTIHFRYPVETGIATHLESCHWERRGWTLQEKLLSTRILYFTKDVVYMECTTTQTSENLGYRLPRRAGFPVMLSESRSISEAERLTNKEAYLSEWYEVVEEYSRRKLTDTKDTLPALEGLAATLSDVVNDTYIYGLWSGDLHRGLLWHSGKGRPRKPFQHGYNAPTWSWACREGSVCWKFPGSKLGWKSCLQVHSITPHSNCSCCNQRVYARLELTADVALLKDLLLEYSDLGMIDENPEDVETWDRVESLDFYDEMGMFDLDEDDKDGLYLPNTLVMLVAEFTEHNSIQALLLQPSDGVLGCFRRVGWFLCNVSWSGENGSDESEVCFEEGRGSESIREYFKPKRLILV